MPNIINNDVPTVYLLGNEKSVFVHLVGDGSVAKVYNGVTRTEDGSLAKGTYTYGVANHFKKAIAPNTLEDAVKCAYSISNEGDTILLSPACASWDQYDSFEDRGKKFKEVINLLNEW